MLSKEERGGRFGITLLRIAAWAALAAGIGTMIVVYDCDSDKAMEKTTRSFTFKYLCVGMLAFFHCCSSQVNHLLVTMCLV
jgi:hypothetical protein